MKKIRYYLAAIALLAVLSGPSLLGAGAMANAASSQHASSALAVGKLTRSGVSKHYWPCPFPGWEC